MPVLGSLEFNDVDRLIRYALKPHAYLHRTFGTEDLTQAAWCRVLEVLPKWDPNKSKESTFIVNYIHWFAGRLFSTKINNVTRGYHPTRICIGLDSPLGEETTLTLEQSLPSGGIDALTALIAREDFDIDPEDSHSLDRVQGYAYVNGDTKLPICENWNALGDEPEDFLQRSGRRAFIRNGKRKATTKPAKLKEPSAPRPRDTWTTAEKKRYSNIRIRSAVKGIDLPEAVLDQSFNAWCAHVGSLKARGGWTRSEKARAHGLRGYGRRAGFEAPEVEIGETFDAWHVRARAFFPKLKAHWSRKEKDSYAALRRHHQRQNGIILADALEGETYQDWKERTAGQRIAMRS